MKVFDYPQTAKLCEKCQVLEISQEALCKSSPSQEATDWEVALDWGLCGRWPQVRDDYHQYTGKVCDFCRHIYSLLYCWRLARELEPMHGQEVSLSLCYVIQRSATESLKLSCLRVTVDAKISDGNNQIWKLDCPIAGVEDILPNTTIDLAEPFTHLDTKHLDWVQTEIKACVQHHNHTHPRQGFVPDRLIKVDEDEPRLVLTDNHPDFSCLGVQPNYAALTYCWGPPQHSEKQLKTTSRSIQSHLQSIPRNKLPQVAKDAMTVTRALGMKYLWIDALCILQDVSSDWDYQCTQMDSIYGNACVTICSASSANCEEGFLFKKDKTPALQVHSSEPGAKPICFSIHLPVCHYFLGEDIDESKWSLRGWTFQERMGSRRIITLGNQNIHFTCQNTTRSMGFERYDLNSESTMIHRDLLTNGETSLVYEGWSNGVAVEFSHSAMEFTHPTDILPSFAGIAALFYHWLQDTYLAGLWKGDLHRGLVWATYRTFRVISLADLLKQLESPSPYIAPSWSWVAKSWVVSGEFTSVFFLPLQSEYVDNIRSEISATNARVVLKGVNPFGEIIGGYIDIQGRVFSPTADLNYIVVNEDESGRRHTMRLGGRYFADIHLDFGFETALSSTGSLDIPISLLLVGSTLKVLSYRRETRTELRKQQQKKTDELGSSSKSYDAGHLTETNISGHVDSNDRPNSDQDDVTEVGAEDGRVAYGIVIYPARKPGEFYRVGAFVSELVELGGLGFFQSCERRTIRLV